MATQESDNPDLRDRGYLYWRLLSTDADAAKQVVLAQKPLISETSERIDPRVLDELIANISTLSSVYHKLPETFVPKLKGIQRRAPLGGRVEEDEEEDELEGSSSASGSIIDVNDLMGALPSTSSPSASSNDFFGTPAAASPSSSGSAAKPLEKQVVLQAGPQSPMEIRANFARRSGRIFLDMTIINSASQPLGSLLVQVKPNVFRLNPVNKSIDVNVMPGQAADYSMVLNPDGPAPQDSAGPVVSFAIKHAQGIVYFNVPVPAFVFFVEEAAVDRTQYIATWRQIPTEKFLTIKPLSSRDVNFLQNRLVSHNVSFIARRKGEESNVVCNLFFSFLFSMLPASFLHSSPSVCRMFCTCQSSSSLVQCSCSNSPLMAKDAVSALRPLPNLW
jgi:AP-1 complex subunit beta-1